MTKKVRRPDSPIDKRLARIIKGLVLIILDFDGIFTDGFVYVGPHGEEFLRCSKKDGMGIRMLKELGVKILVLTSEENDGPIIARCKKLGIEYETGVKDKEDFIVSRMNIDTDKTAYMGDDINDLAAMKHCGLKITVADGHPAIKKIADITTKAKGGQHAIREAVELILSIRN